MRNTFKESQGFFFKRVMRTIIKTIWFSHVTESEERIQNSALLGAFFIIKIATQQC